MTNTNCCSNCVLNSKHNLTFSTLHTMSCTCACILVSNVCKMNGMKIAAGWLINLHTLSNLQLLLATLTVASKFTDWRYVAMWDQSWITRAERKTRYMVFLLFVGNFGFSGSAITHMAKIKDA